MEFEHRFELEPVGESCLSRWVLRIVCDFLNDQHRREQVMLIVPDELLCPCGAIGRVKGHRSVVMHRELPRSGGHEEEVRIGLSLENVQDGRIASGEKQLIGEAVFARNRVVERK